MVCRALAVEFNIPMLLVQPSDIFDMWLGESEKLAKAVFVSSSIRFPKIPHLNSLLRALLTELHLVLSSLMKLMHYSVLAKVGLQALVRMCIELW